MNNIFSTLFNRQVKEIVYNLLEIQLRQHCLPKKTVQLMLNMNRTQIPIITDNLMLITPSRNLIP